ncbi:helix-turn-helix domain-containing protein [Enterococcus sp. LJL128]|uniref:helix-turn-helix domain-containing protein n=1 Tax=Enterococcus sp. LJL51 TaxID=3416656 RepID=UPI003CEC3A7D
MEVIDILDFETKKIIEILGILQNATEDILLKSLAEKLAVHVKTVRKYLYKLQGALKDSTYQKELVLTLTEKDSVRLRNSNSLYLERFRMLYIYSTPEVYILEKVVTASPISIVDLTNHFSESEAKMRKRITKIREWLKPYYLGLRHNTLELTGTELQIREFIAKFRWQIFQGFDSWTNGHLSGKATTLCDGLIGVLQMRVNHIQKQQLMLIICIQLHRIEQKKSIALKSEMESFCLDSELYKYFINEIRKKRAAVLSSEEYMYLFLTVLAKYAATFSRRIGDKSISDYYKSKSRVQICSYLGAKMLKQVFWEKEIIFTKKIYIAMLSFHLYHELWEGFYYEKTSALHAMTLIYPVCFLRLNQGISQLQKISKSFKAIHKEELLFRYFQIFTRLCSPVSLEKRKNIYLALEWPIEQKGELKTKILSFFRQRKNIKIIEAGAQTEYNNADIILTTALHPIFTNENITCPVLFITNMDDHILFFQLESLLEDKK